MKVIEPSALIVGRPENREEGIELLRQIERLARISHRAEDKQTDDSWFRFVGSVVMVKGDWSVVEHVSTTVIFRVDRGVTHELVRHRLFSFTQESTRFVNGRKSYPNGLEFIKPLHLPDACYRDWQDVCALAENRYLAMLDAGARPQEARSVLPNSLASTIAVTGNLRNWRHLFIMRTTQEAHPDFKRVMVPLLVEFQQRIPLLFDDIIPNQKQSEALSKPR